MAKQTKTKCPYCGSTRLASDGYRKTKAGKLARKKCKNCGKYHTVGSLVSLAIAQQSKLKKKARKVKGKRKVKRR